MIPPESDPALPFTNRELRKVENLVRYVTHLDNEIADREAKGMECLREKQRRASVAWALREIGNARGVIL